MAQRQKTDINLYQGDTRSYKFTMTQNGSPWNVSGATNVKLGVKASLDQAATLFEATATDGQNGNNFAGGILVFEITAVQSVLLTKNGKYDVQLTLASKPITPVYGDVILQRQVVA